MSLSKKTSSLKVSLNTTLISAMRKMDELDRKSLLVFNNDKFVNILSIGDIQRAILDNKGLNSKISNILRKNTKLADIDTTMSEVKKTMKKYRMELLPVIDKKGKLEKVYYWEDIFEFQKINEGFKLNLPVIIMAGGKGTRLKPLTNVIPKPIIPVGDFTIIEEIISRFQDYGCQSFYSSVNYKSETIEFYFNHIKKKSYNISFFKESKPLGTAGSLALLKGKINSTFFVSNCDILVNTNYEDVYKYHKKNDNEITLVSAIKSYSIPYGTLETKRNGMLSKINEKPEINFQVNTGFYIVEPHLIDDIPKDTFYHITHLIEKLIKEKRKVGVFPVSLGSWTDLGVWSEYLKYIGIQH